MGVVILAKAGIQLFYVFQMCENKLKEICGND